MYKKYDNGVEDKCKGRSKAGLPRVWHHPDDAGPQKQHKSTPAVISDTPSLN